MIPLLKFCVINMIVCSLDEKILAISAFVPRTFIATASFSFTIAPFTGLQTQTHTNEIQSTRRSTKAHNLALCSLLFALTVYNSPISIPAYFDGRKCQLAHTLNAP